MAETLDLVFDNFTEIVVTQVKICIRYLFCYNNIIQNLRDESKNLEEIKDWVQLPVVIAKNNTEVVAPQVQSWLKKVEKIEMESDQILNGNKSSVDKCCFLRWCPNPKSKYLLSREASKKACIIVELQNEGKEYRNFSYPAVLAGVSAYYSAADSSQSKFSTRKEIMDALKNDTIALIGICGKGEGKTKMVQEIAKEMKFDDFAIAAVSRNNDVNKIQGQLADLLGLELGEQASVLERATQLYARLTCGDKILVVLDDVWETFNMGEIGIPIGGERMGCKVVLTSHNELVCSQMGTQKNITIEDTI